MAHPEPGPGEALVCVVVKAWPRVSTTFVAQELVGLEREGLRLWLASIARGGGVRHALHDQLLAPVHHLSGSAAPRLLKAWRKARRMPGYAAARALLRADLAAGAGRKRLRAFARALILASEMPSGTQMVYAHFLTSGTDVARYAAAIRSLPLAASAHARDIWTTPDWDKAAKLAQMQWCATCTTSGAEHLRSRSDDPAKVHLIYHGLSFERFPSDPPDRPSRDGSAADDPVRLLTVGRAVEKKGFDVLLDALARLPSDLAWRLDHVGGGELVQPLQEQARALGLAGRIEWHGTQSQAQVIALYRDCDLFVLPSREGSDGDRDGLPNVLMEAQSQALACVSTSFSAIPELIMDGETGLLVPPGEAAPLGSALERLIRSPSERERIGAAGFDRVRANFRAEAGISRIAALLRNAMATAATAA